MNHRLQAFVYGAILALIAGWVLYVGREIFVPIVLGILVVYVIVGVARLLRRIPWLGRVLPVPIHYTLSVLIIVLTLVLVAYLVIASRERGWRSPTYRESLLAAIKFAAFSYRIRTDMDDIAPRCAEPHQPSVVHWIDGRFGVLHCRLCNRRAALCQLPAGGAALVCH
jgi:hypothetical protein